MSYLPTSAPGFLTALSQWFRCRPELLVLIRFRAGAGSKEFRLFSSFPEFLEVLQALPPGACVSGFLGSYLPFGVSSMTASFRPALVEFQMDPSI